MPGEAGVWVFIMGDMLIFGLFFGAFLFYRAQNLEIYTASQVTLNQDYGVLNTILLLTSSLFVVMGLQAARIKEQKLVPIFFMLALACGVGFGVVKAFEWAEKISHGLTLVTNEFYMFYYILTGVHALHVLIGIGVLIYLVRYTQKRVNSEFDIQLLESGASYWHMVDLLWIVLFPLFYLMK